MNKSKNNILLIGKNSDLTLPLENLAKSKGIDFLSISRDDWDLQFKKPSKEVLDKLISFNPINLVFSAGKNIKLKDPLDIDESLETIYDHFLVNCLSFITISLLMQKHLNKGLKSIHVLSSLYGTYGRKSRMPYCISKHALEGAIKSLSLEFPDTQIIGYRPGFFKTKLTENNLSETEIENIAKIIPLKRLGSPSEISSIILNNIINPQEYLTGQVINIDGGFTSGGFFQI